MKRNTLFTTATLFAGLLLPVQAGSKEEVAEAIKKLAEKGSYSWTSTSKRPGEDAEADGRGGPRTSSGSTADGFVLLTNTRGDRTFETLIKGEKVAVKRDDGWALVGADRPAGDGEERGEGRRRGGRGFGRGFADFKAPAASAEELLGQVAELTKEGDVYSGELTEEGTRELVPFGGGRRRGGDDAGAERPVPAGVKANAKFWVQDGVLAKYETSVTGSITFGDNERDLSRVTTVEIKDAGSAKVDVPEDAKKLFAAASE